MHSRRRGPCKPRFEYISATTELGKLEQRVVTATVTLPLTRHETALWLWGDALPVLTEAQQYLPQRHAIYSAIMDETTFYAKTTSFGLTLAPHMPLCATQPYHDTMRQFREELRSRLAGFLLARRILRRLDECKVPPQTVKYFWPSICVLHKGLDWTQVKENNLGARLLTADIIKAMRETAITITGALMLPDPPASSSEYEMAVQLDDFARVESTNILTIPLADAG